MTAAVRIDQPSRDDIKAQFLGEVTKAERSGEPIVFLHRQRPRLRITGRAPPPFGVLYVKTQPLDPHRAPLAIGHGGAMIESGDHVFAMMCSQARRGELCQPPVSLTTSDLQGPLRRQVGVLYGQVRADKQCPNHSEGAHDHAPPGFAHAKP